MSRYTDLAYAQDDEGIFDLILDGTGDFETTDGLETAITCSLFSDARAYADDVADPMKRRGWIGDLVSDVPGDRHGSWLWLYEQARGTQEVILGVRNAARQSLEWMIEEKLVTSVDVQAVFTPDQRALRLTIVTESPRGGTSVRAYELALATRNGTLARLGAI